MPNLHDRADYGSFAPMRPGRAAPYPGSDGGWRQTPGSGFGWDSRCPQCGKTKQTTEEWGWDDADNPSSYYYANVTGYPYGSTPMQTQQQSRYSRCPFCGQIWSTTTTAYPQQPVGTGPALALAPAQAEDNFYGTRTYYGPSFPGHYLREEWHSGSPVPFNDDSMAYQDLYSSMGTGPYGHYWQQRHQEPYSPSPSGAPYDPQSPYYPTTDAYDRANQGIPVGGYPYRIPGRGMSGPARQRVQLEGTCDLQPLTGTNKTVDFLPVELPISFVPVHLQPLRYGKCWWHGPGL